MSPLSCLSGFASAVASSGGMARTTKTSTGWRSATILSLIMEADCALNAGVANGGFGFGYGIRGAMGGFDGRGSGTIVEQYLARSSGEEVLTWAGGKVRLIDLADYDDQWEEVTGACRDKVVRTFWHLILPSHFWPERFLPICHWGCAIESCLDCTRGGIYQVGSPKRKVT